ncbi:trigger factor [Acaryochloris marina]|uniref:Trigger factor n=1 Tax=Acaryochloris marina (strain MBIC 11017) TaxID=329726 RepID=B0C144_ACAM1|nr:trigger factor [Acaryochloris marina]ABW28442.1 trigger factor [Acaryochloris marina MBIC11017]BDM77443.1 trigger factor [Acaryochloris marina MBIC10699]
MSKTKELLKVTQEKLPGSQISLEIEISPEQSRQAYEQVIIKFMRSANIPGFRKGKVPKQVILQRFGTDQLKASALEDLVQKNFEAAVKQEEIEALGNVQFRSSFDELAAEFEPGKAIVFAVSVDVPPEVTLKKYQDFKVTAEKIEYEAAKVDEVLEEHRSSNATLVPVEDRAAAANDVTLVDFESRFLPSESDADEEGETPEGESVQDFQLELVKGKFIDDLIDGIIGMQIGETKNIAVTLPQEYFQDELAGRSAEFTVSLKDIKAKELPPLDDDFAQDVSEFSTLAELRQFLEEQYQQEAQDSTDANVEAALLEALIEELDVDLPESMIDDELNVMIRETLSRLQSNGLDINKLVTKEMLGEMKERMRSDAIPRLKRTLALAEVAKAESITVEADAIADRCQEILKDLQGQDIDRDRLEAVVEDELLHKQVVAWLTEHSEVELVEPKPEEDAAEAEAKAEEEATAKEVKPSEAKKSAKSTAKKASTKKAKSAKVAEEVADETKEESAAKKTPAKAKRSTAKTTKKTSTKTKKTSAKPKADDSATDSE